MKRYLSKSFIIVLTLLCAVIFCTSCKEQLDAGEMLEYESGAPEYDLTFCVGEEEYPMHLTLDELDSENGGKVRDGRAEITGGVLEGVGFVMKDGALKMAVGELEYPLEEKDSSALYLLFSAFSLKESGFIGATEDSDGLLSARFDGRYEFTLTLDADTYSPVRAEAECGSGICALVFKTEGTA